MRSWGECTRNNERTVFSVWSVSRSYNEDNWSNEVVQFCTGGYEEKS
jgi:hypothetical protein